jgi:hypothetical protein
VVVVDLLNEGEQARAGLAGTDRHCRMFLSEWYTFTVPDRYRSIVLNTPVAMRSRTRTSPISRSPLKIKSADPRHQLAGSQSPP